MSKLTDDSPRSGKAVSCSELLEDILGGPLGTLNQLLDLLLCRLSVLLV